MLHTVCTIQELFQTRGPLKRTRPPRTEFVRSSISAHDLGQCARPPSKSVHEVDGPDDTSVTDDPSAVHVDKWTDGRSADGCPHPGRPEADSALVRFWYLLIPVQR